MHKTPAHLFSCFFYVISIASVANAASLPDFTDLVEGVNPIVTQISTDVKTGTRTRQGPSGSGFIISNDGYVLTNHHVVSEAEAVRVHLHDGRVVTAKKIGQDEASDVAVLKIEAKNLVPAKIGNVNALKPGAWVLAFGAPFGFDHSVSAGIVSAKGRSLPWNAYVPFIQSDAAINRGNSGGPLVNAAGEVVGINSQILSSNGGSIGLSFSIPIDLAMDVAEQLKKNGKVARGYIGVGYEDVKPEIAESFGLDRPRGAVVNQVSKGDPGDKAGLKAGDVIMSIDNLSIEQAGDLPVIVGRLKPGTKAKFNVMRNGQATNITVTIGERPNDGRTASSEASPVRLGITVAELTSEQMQELNVDTGVVVRAIEDGPFADAGIRPADVLLSINRVEIKSVTDFNSAVATLPKGRSVPVHVVRRGNAQFLVLRVPE